MKVKLQTSPPNGVIVLVVDFSMLDMNSGLCLIFAYRDPEPKHISHRIDGGLSPCITAQAPQA
jgi:hypothetical protein